MTYREVSYVVAPSAAFSANSALEVLALAALTVGVALYLDYRAGNLRGFREVDQDSDARICPQDGGVCWDPCCEVKFCEEGADNADMDASDKGAGQGTHRRDSCQAPTRG